MKINAKYGIVAALTMAAFVAPSVSAYTYTDDKDYDTYTFNTSEKATIANCVKKAKNSFDTAIVNIDTIQSTTEYQVKTHGTGYSVYEADGETLATLDNSTANSTNAGDNGFTTEKLAQDALKAQLDAETEALKTEFKTEVLKCVTSLTKEAKLFDNTVSGGAAAGNTSALEADVETAKGNIKTAEKAVTTAERALTKAETNATRAKTKYDNAIAAAKVKYPDYTDAEIAAVSTVSNAKDALDDAQAKLEAAQLDLQDAKDGLADAKDAKTEADQALADNKAEIAANELESAETKLTKAQEDLDDAKDILAARKEALDDAQEELNEAKTDLNNAKADLRAAKKSDPNYSTLEKAVTDAENNVKTKQAAVDSAKTDVKNAEADVKTEEKKVAAAEKLVADKKTAADKAEEATKISIASVAVSGVAKAYAYTGSEIKPTVTVKHGDTTLAAGTDYTVSYSANKAVGTATITISGKGNYSGTKTVNFYIDPAKSSIKKIATGAKSMTVTVKKGTAATGVQIAYRVKGASAWKYTTTTSTSKAIKSLKKGKKYQVVVRSYVKKDGVVTNYSGWSATKTTAAVK